MPRAVSYVEVCYVGEITTKKFVKILMFCPRNGTCEALALFDVVSFDGAFEAFRSKVSAEER